MTSPRDILSVDVESLIRKRAAYTFRSPHHYPVELVRDAARRGARTVTIRLTGTHLELEDDGQPHDASDLRALATLMDPTAPAAERLAALDIFEVRRGLGLLAAFAPTPSMVRCERPVPGPGVLEVRTGVGPILLEKAGPCAGTGTNRLVLARKGYPAEERRVLAEWCQHSSMGVIVNEVAVGGMEPAPHLGLAQVHSEDRAGSGRLWLPVRGEACRIRLLDHGIQWRMATYGPDHGLLYEAAVESPEVPPAHLRRHLRSVALDVYAAAIAARETLPPSARDRLDELVFLHHRQTGSLDFMGSYAPFRVAGANAHRTLDDLRGLAARGPLEALPEDALLERFATEDGEVLLLTPRQWEYLEEHAGIPLVPPPRRARHRGAVGRAIGDLGRAARAALGALHSQRPISRANMDDGEAALVDSLAAALRKGRCYLPGLEGVRDVAVELLPGGAWRPAAVIRTSPKPRVLLHRANKDVRRAARAVGQDRDLLILALPLLFNGHEGWI